jgi:polysaccharide export outer membrane protein
MTNTLRRALSSARSLAALVAIILPAVLAAAGAGRAQAVDDVPYTLAPGDRIALVVIGQPEISGPLSVDNSGEIQVPLLGSLKVAGDTLSQCQEKILSGLSQGYLRDPAVFVSLAEVRPIHVLGDVRSPGTFPYRFGSIVKSAISNAGGLGSSLRSDTSLAEYLAADERVRVLKATRDRLLVRKARLEAHLAGSNTFVMPQQLASADADLKPLVAEEQRTLDIATSAFETRRKLLEGQRPLMAAEHDALDGQIASQKEQIKLLKNEIAAIASLKGKGLARSNSVLELGLALSTKESDLWKLQADRSRLLLAINDLDARISQSDQAQKDQLLADLGLVQQGLYDVEVALPSAIAQRATRFRLVGQTLDKAPVYEARITRVGMKDIETFIATETTRLEPGDIVDIRIAVENLESIKAPGQ